MDGGLSRSDGGLARIKRGLLLIDHLLGDSPAGQQRPRAIERDPRQLGAGARLLKFRLGLLRCGMRLFQFLARLRHLLARRFDLLPRLCNLLVEFRRVDFGQQLAGPDARSYINQIAADKAVGAR